MQDKKPLFRVKSPAQFQAEIKQKTQNKLKELFLKLVIEEKYLKNSKNLLKAKPQS